MYFFLLRENYDYLLTGFPSKILRHFGGLLKWSLIAEKLIGLIKLIIPMRQRFVSPTKFVVMSCEILGSVFRQDEHGRFNIGLVVTLFMFFALNYMKKYMYFYWQ